MRLSFQFKNSKKDLKAAATTAAAFFDTNDSFFRVHASSLSINFCMRRVSFSSHDIISYCVLHFHRH
jgi:hypothetical protein